MNLLLRTIVVVILSVVIEEISCQKLKPCTNVFQYQKEGEKLFGIITIPPQDERKWIVLNVTIGSNGPAHNGESYLELVKSRDETAKDALEAKSIQYRLLFPVQEGGEIPTVTKINLNGNDICRGPSVFYTNNWSFKHSFLYGEKSLRTEHASQTEEIYPTFYDWLYAQPEYINFLSNSTMPEAVRRTTEEPDMKPMPMIAINPRIADDGEWLRDLPFQCGMKPPMQSRLEVATLILNGTVVARGEFPWLVYLEYTDRSLICGGTLVSDRHIITAAHCVKGQKITGVYLGKHDRFAMEPGSIRRDPRVIIVHPEYKTEEAHADIAIIVIDPVPLSQQIFPACIWPFGIQLDAAFPFATIAGWGLFHNEEPSSRVPMKTMVPIVSLEMCRKSNEHFQRLATDNTICAGGQYSGPCYGDSGSGFYFRHKTTWYLRGVVSTSLRDSNNNYCQANHYAVYVDIAFYLDWLRPYITDIENEVVKITSRIDTRFKNLGKATIEIDT